MKQHSVMRKPASPFAKPSFLLGSLALAAFLPAPPATAQSSGAPAVSSEVGRAESSAISGQTTGQASRSGNMETLIQEAPRPGIPAGEKKLQRLKRASGGKSDGSPGVPPAR